MAQPKLKKKVSKSNKRVTKATLSKVKTKKTKRVVSTKVNRLSVNNDLSSLLERARNLRATKLEVPSRLKSPKHSSVNGRSRRVEVSQEHNEVDKSAMLSAQKIQAIQNRLRQFDQTSKEIQSKKTSSLSRRSKVSGVSPYETVNKRMPDSQLTRRSSAVGPRKQTRSNIQEVEHKMGDSVQRLNRLYERLRSITGS